MLKAFLHNTRLPLRLRKKIGKLIRVREGRTFSQALFENTYTGITGNHLDDKTYLYGMHEPASIRFMRDVLTAQRMAGRSPCYMDVGTNTGAHLLAIAARADRAIGFEPWAPVRACAAANIARNALPHVTLLDCGLGARDEKLPFAPPVAGNHGTGSFFRHDEASTDILHVRAGDNVVSELNIVPTLIKIDTEGFEDAILQGLTHTLRKSMPVVVFEYSAMTKAQLAQGGALQKLFGDSYAFYGLKPSREYPSLESFRPGRRYENVVAWPHGPMTPDAVSSR